MRILQVIGNKSLWEHEKTLFLTSRQAPLSCYEKVFRWVEEFDKQGCAVCFNTSELEGEVLKALLVYHVPTTLVVTGRFRDNYNVQIEQALKEKRLLIMVLQREDSDGKGSLARLRNHYVISHVQHIVCGYINPNGSIFGLLAGHINITYLLSREDICQAADPETKPYRWTVAEDKRLLHMFYEDMGIHAIHKAIDRPYSTIYNRIKSLTMNDELLKGREFEDYVLERMDIPNNNKLILKEWRGDKSIPGIYPENNSAPDFVFEYDGKSFAVECKWRSHISKNIEKELLPQTRVSFFQQFSAKRCMRVFLLLGIGGLPNDPEYLYLSNLENEVSTEALFQNGISSTEDILPHILSRLNTYNQSHPTYITELRKTYPNVYKPWTEQDDQQLTSLYLDGKSIEELILVFHRNRGSITSRLRKLNVI